MIKITNEALARFGYLAYRRKASFKSWNGDVLPEWDALPETIKQNWIAVAISMRTWLKYETTDSSR